MIQSRMDRGILDTGSFPRNLPNPKRCTGTSHIKIDKGVTPAGKEGAKVLQDWVERLSTLVNDIKGKSKLHFPPVTGLGKNCRDTCTGGRFLGR